MNKKANREMAQVISNDYPGQIKRLRVRLGLTQMALAEELGVSFPTINRWENGKARPSQLSWSRLMELVGGEEEEKVGTEQQSFNETRPPSILDFTERPEVIQAVVEAERLSFGHLSNPVFATEIASIDPLPHQRIAVYDHMLNQPRLRFLLADDAGAGKTIMTGLYIREMLTRRLLKRVLIVSPAGLVGNWQRELSTLFSLQFDVVSGKDARDANPFSRPGSDRLIVSIDTLVGDRVFSRFQAKEVEPYDLVVFDEAHKLSSDRGADLRVSKTGRYRLAEVLAGVFTGDKKWRLSWQTHHLLLLTATPHMGKDYPFFALWRLLEPEMLSTFEAFEDFPAQRRKALFIRRTKEEMVHLDGRPLYPKRISDTLGYDLSQGDISEQTLYDEATEYLRFVYNKAKMLNRSAARLAMGVFQRRLASSTYALLRSFERRIEKLNRIINDVQTGKISIEQLLTLQRRMTEDQDVFESKTADEESPGDGLEENEVSEDQLLEGVIAVSLADLLAEREQVIHLRDLAQTVYDAGGESKFDKLQEVVTDPRFTEEKLIVFTEHRDTLDFLVRRLSGMGYTGQIAQIHGGMHYTEREEQVERFRKPVNEGGARFLICTDAAGEGINLQFCWIMINYDVPWNPARLEQRMGRIHRYGQKHDPVIILNLVSPSTREGKVLKTLLDKLEKIRKQLKSEKVFDSIGRIFSDISIKAYMEMAVLGDADLAAQELDSRFTKDQVKALEDREKKLYGDGGDVRKELPRIKQGVEQESFFRLLPGYIRRFIQSSAPLLGLEVEGDLGGQFALNPQQKVSADQLLSAFESYPMDQQSRLTVYRPEKTDNAIWVRPGEPVFERLRQLVLTRFAAKALRGAVFVDPTATKPYLFHLARLTVVRKADPEMEELSQEESIDCRLVGIVQSEGVDINLCPVEHLLLLRGGHGLPAEGQRLAVEAIRQKELAESYLAERVARMMAVERRSQMLEALPQRQAFVKRGFDFQEAELAAARAAFSQKTRSGNKAAATELNRIKEQQRDLSQRRENALVRLLREPELIVPGGVEFIAHALVVPSSEEADRERHQAKVEEVAMELVRAFEETAGADIRYVHTPQLARSAGLPEHPGFDILSHRPGGIRRCIEVKGRADIGEVEVTDNEWARACNLREEYWLYVVYHCATSTPQLVRVQDPFEKLLVRPFSKVQTSERTIRSTQEVSGVKVGHTQVMEAGEV